MSQENLEIVERAMRAAMALPEPDFETVNELYAPDHVLAPAGVEMGIEREEQGAGGFRAWREVLAESFSAARHELHGVVDVGPDKVLAVNTTHTAGRTSGVASKQRIWSVVTIFNGKIVRTESYTDSAKALKALRPAE